MSALVPSSSVGGRLSPKLPKHVRQGLAEIGYDGALGAKRIEAVHHVTMTGMLAATSIVQTKRSLARDDPLTDLALSDIAATGINAINIIITMTALS